MNSSIAEDTSRLDMIVLPIAFVIMAAFVKSLRLLIIPAVCIALSILWSFTVVYGLTEAMTIPSYVRRVAAIGRHHPAACPTHHRWLSFLWCVCVWCR